VAEEGEPGPAIHLPFDHLGPGVHALGPAVVEGQGDGGGRGLWVQVQPAGEGMNDRQVAAAGSLSPVFEPGLVLRVWPEQGRERTDQRGEAGHLGAGRGQLAEQLLLARAEGGGPGEQERWTWRCRGTGPGRSSRRSCARARPRLEGFNDRIIALYARGMTTRDIRAHLREMYDVDVSPDLISRVTDGVLEELAEWQGRPPGAVYPVIFTGALMVKIRDGVVANRPVYLAIGIDCEGAKQVLGLWVGPTTGESAKFWLSVLSELRSRGVADVCIVCCDGLTGLPDAIGVTTSRVTRAPRTYVLRPSTAECQAGRDHLHQPNDGQ